MKNRGYCWQDRGQRTGVSRAEFRIQQGRRQRFAGWKIEVTDGRAEVTADRAEGRGHQSR